MSRSVSHNDTYGATAPPPRLEFYRSDRPLNATAFETGVEADALILYGRVASRLDSPGNTVPAADVIDQLERED